MRNVLDDPKRFKFNGITKIYISLIFYPNLLEIRYRKWRQINSQEKLLNMNTSAFNSPKWKFDKKYFLSQNLD